MAVWWMFCNVFQLQVCTALGLIRRTIWPCPHHTTTLWETPGQCSFDTSFWFTSSLISESKSLLAVTHPAEISLSTWIGPPPCLQLIQYVARGNHYRLVLIIHIHISPPATEGNSNNWPQRVHHSEFAEFHCEPLWSQYGLDPSFHPQSGTLFYVAVVCCPSGFRSRSWTLSIKIDVSCCCNCVFYLFISKGKILSKLKSRVIISRITVL